MAKKTEKWKPTCKRYVAFLDIMGFKDMVFRKKHEEVRETLEMLQHAITLIRDIEDFLTAKGEKENELRKDKSENIPSIIKTVSFSDSILLISSDASLFSAAQILSFVGLIISKAIEEKIPIKGAIAYGLQTADLEKSLYFGIPLIDAYELQKELLLYGAVIHHTMEKKLIEIGVTERWTDGKLLKSHVPMRARTGRMRITHYLVDWTTSLADKENAIEVVSRLYNDVSGAPRLYVDNTIAFVEELIERKATIVQQQKKQTSRPSTKIKQS